MKNSKETWTITKTELQKFKRLDIQTRLIRNKKKKLSPKEIIVKYNLDRVWDSQDIDMLDETVKLAYN